MSAIHDATRAFLQAQEKLEAIQVERRAAAESAATFRHHLADAEKLHDDLRQRELTAARAVANAAAKIAPLAAAQSSGICGANGQDGTIASNDEPEAQRVEQA